jgi:glycine/D-amino acid oxidase-like deaminating enzyme
MGSVTELLDDMAHIAETEILQLFEQRQQGLLLLRKRLGDTAIGYAENGSYELISKQETDALDKIEYLNKQLLPFTKKPAFSRADEKISEFGFNKNYTRALIENTCEGELHSGKMMRAITDMAIRKGIEIKTGTQVSRFEEDNNLVRLFINDPIRLQTIVFTCNTLSICTNAFTQQLLPEVDVIPGRGQVLITAPIPNLKFKGIFHFDKGYYYFRVIDNRLLIGGGRNLDFETERTTNFAINEQIQTALEDKLTGIIIPETQFEIAQRWTGIMAFGSTKFPIVRAFSEQVFGAFRMGGMGVALGSLTAKKLVDIIAQNRD